MIAPSTSIGKRPNRVTFQSPGPPIMDGDGGYTEDWTDLDPPAMFVAITTATTAALEHVTQAGATTITTATHLVTGPFHPGVTTKSRVLFNGREFQVNAVINVDEQSVEMVLVCTELLTP